MRRLSMLSGGEEDKAICLHVFDPALDLNTTRLALHSDTSRPPDRSKAAVPAALHDVGATLEAAGVVVSIFIGR